MPTGGVGGGVGRGNSRESRTGVRSHGRIANRRALPRGGSRSGDRSYGRREWVAGSTPLRNNAGMKEPTTTPAALAPFEPGIRDWFADSFAAPTAIQALAWPVIARGEHVLLTAPTGSGKTLTAFLWALNEFAAGRTDAGATRVLYVSPLKALNNDIERNLLAPLAALRERGAVPALRVATRSGDTPQGERQRLLRRPPEILITTPESLTLLLTTTRGRHALGGVSTVIVDEVHAMADSRRGTLLLTGLERLVDLAGEFQRVALSATVRPLEKIAAFVAGHDRTGQPRAIRTVEAGGGAGAKQIDLRVCFPEAAQRASDNGQKIWEALAPSFREIIGRNRATLFFTNSRRLAERITLAINKDQHEPLAYAHHGSLSREIRVQVEERLKRGDLKAIVATSSLEMGIDIGALDEVVMVQSPPTVAAALQRIGRAGHQVGEVSRGTLFPTFAQDFVDAAALAAAVGERDIEPMQPLENPLDVLAQVIVSMTATEPWPVEALYALLCRSGSYHRLPRAHFDLVLEMLAGRYAGTRVRELKPRIRYDRLRQVVLAEHSAVLALYNSGGVIPDRGYFQIRHLESGTVIGELDEEFVWEATVGQVFSLGTQNWQIHRITHNDVLVRPTGAAGTAPPFWRSETQSRSYHYARRVGEVLEHAEKRLSAGEANRLRADWTDSGFDDLAAEELTAYLQRQRDAVAAPLPHRRHLLLERVLSGPGGYRGPDQTEQLVIHTFWGGRVNRPWALALAAALERGGVAVEVHADDHAVVLQSRDALDGRRVLRLVDAGNLQELLRASLETSGFFGARFREAAGRALLLSRQRFNARLPLWMSRLQAKKLMVEVADLPDFPLMLEAWRSCLVDEFDLPALQTCLAEVADGTVAVSTRVSTSPSPFAGQGTFVQINRYMYDDDTPLRRQASGLADELIRSAVQDPALRPRLAPATVAAFEAKRQRTAPGYAPESAADWAEWVKERILLPATEAAASVGAGTDPATGAGAVLDHPDVVEIGDDGRRWFCHRELLHALRDSGLAGGAQLPPVIPALPDPRSASDLALEVLSFYGPLTRERIETILPTVPADLLDDEQALVRGPLLADDDGIYYCDAANFEALLRLQRALARSRLDPQPAATLPAHLAAWQGLRDALSPAEYLEPLRGYRAPVSVWLNDLPAARQRPWLAHELDAAFAELGFAWQGAGAGQVRLGYPEDLALLQESSAPADPAAADAPGAEPAVAALFADPDARYPFLQLADRQSAPLGEFSEHWWSAVWRGEVRADTLTPLRQGVARDFKLPLDTASRRPAQRGRPSGRALAARAPRFRRSAYADPWSGNWQLISRGMGETDALTALEDARERARLLIDRYGFVCRELANREGGRLRWSELFRALRVMELGGEVVAGLFFEGLSGPQFAAPTAVAALLAAEPPAGTFWVSALDAVSPCGLGLDWPELPQRRPGNYLAFLEGRLALVIENGGKRLTFFVPAEHPRLAETLEPLAYLLDRERRLGLEWINCGAAAGSPYLPALERLGRLVSDHRSTYLEPATA
jgi:ATP-dependent helicase Lhr and Lhr-like helicase